MTTPLSIHAARALALAAATLALAACDDDVVAPGLDRPAQVRFVNAVRNRATSPAGTALDILAEGGDGAPSARAIPFASATEYRAVPASVYDFTVAVAGDTRGEALANVLRFTPRLRLVGDFSYTMVVAGVVPPTGVSAPGQVAPIWLADDRFPPGRAPDGRYNARLRLVNAAPFAAPNVTTGGIVGMYVTPGLTPPASVSSIADLGQAVYRGATGYVDVAAGDYTITVAGAGGSRILARQSGTLAPGAVRTLVLVSTGTAPVATPGPANHAILSLTDADHQ